MDNSTSVRKFFWWHSSHYLGVSYNQLWFVFSFRLSSCLPFKFSFQDATWFYCAYSETNFEILTLRCQPHRGCLVSIVCPSYFKDKEDISVSRDGHKPMAVLLPSGWHLEETRKCWWLTSWQILVALCHPALPPWLSVMYAVLVTTEKAILQISSAFSLFPSLI